MTLTLSRVYSLKVESKGEMKMTWLKIDDVAKKTGLTKRSIRYYEEIGLIRPPKRSDGRVRLYTEEDVERLIRIMDAREVLGFSLQELLEFIEVNDTLQNKRSEYRSIQDEDEEERIQKLIDIEEVLKRQIAMMEQKMKKIELFKRDAESLLERVTKGLNKRRGKEK